VTQISSLFDIPDFLLDSWSGTPKVSHSILSISRGPKGSVKATAIGVDGAADSGSEIDDMCGEGNPALVIESTLDLNNI